MRLKRVFLIPLFLVIFSSMVWGYTYYLSSDRSKLQAQFASSVYTADQAAIFTGRGLFQGIFVTTDGTNNVTVSIYDNTTNAGTLITPTFVVLGTSRTFALSYSPGIAFATGISVDITIAGGGSASYQVFYDK